MKATGTKLIRVPYKGFAQSLPDIMAGRVHMNVAPLSAVLPYGKDGRVRILAVLTPQRSRFAPEFPALAEAGVPNLAVPGWQAIFAPAKTPKEILDRLTLEIGLTLHDAEIRAQFERQAVQLQGSTAEELATIVQNDVQTSREFIRENGITTLDN
ncbi:MAG: hypothetical protein HY056_16625 [Proteobacteria bacterium]|nr:hypothetical protein [Pseudomonadota bacterium]